MKAYLLVAILGVALLPVRAEAQSSSRAGQPSGAGEVIVGTLVSLQADALVIRVDDDRQVAFVCDRSTARSEALAPGARVRVESTAARDANGPRRATGVFLVAPTETPQPPAGQRTTRQIERQVKETVRHYRLGVRGGVALDPELITIGVHMMLGPIFTSRLLLRPNVEFAYGELTTLFAVNAEAIYRLTATMPRDRWSPYVGGGPTFGFSHLGFTTPAGTERSFDFGTFDFHAGLNLLAGFEKPSGVFIELKSTIYTDPHLRLLVGYSF